MACFMRRHINFFRRINAAKNDINFLPYFAPIKYNQYLDMVLLHQVFFFYIALQSILLGILLAHNRSVANNRWLSAYFFISTFSFIFKIVIRNTTFFDSYPFGLVFYDVVTLTNGAVLFHFVQILVRKTVKKSHFYALFAPALLYGLVMTVAYALTPWDSAHGFYGNRLFFATSFPTGLTLIVFYSLSLILLKNALKTANLFSNIELLKIKWAQIMQVVLLLKTGLGISMNVLQTRFHGTAWFGEAQQIYVLVIYILQTVLLLTLTYLTLRRSAIFNEVDNKANFEERLVSVVLPEKAKTERPQLLTSEQKEALLHRLQALMSTEKPYLIADLTLLKLADLLDTNPHTLSWLLNDSQNLNFNQYINFFRIEEAKRLLSLPDNAQATNYAVALESGFNAEQTFYTVFKKQIGSTPNQYKKQQQMLDSFAANGE